MDEAENGDWIRHSDAMDEIEKRDLIIAELRSAIEDFEDRLVGCSVHIADMRTDAQKRDDRIAELESRLSACAAGPWRRITAEDRTPDKAKLIMQFCSDYGFSDISTAYYAGMFDGKHNWSIEAEYISEGEDWMITTINPPEAASCAR
jgi:hypothetical protein